MVKLSINKYDGETNIKNDYDLDDNEYYASRGASVCSALLHAMAQIDERSKFMISNPFLSSHLISK